MPRSPTLSRGPSRPGLFYGQLAFTLLLEELLVLPIAIPGLALGLALIITYGGWHAFRISWLFILTGYVLYTLPFMIRAVSAVLESIGPVRRSHPVVPATPGVFQFELAVDATADAGAGCVHAAHADRALGDALGCWLRQAEGRRFSVDDEGWIGWVGQGSGIAKPGPA